MNFGEYLRGKLPFLALNILLSCFCAFLLYSVRAEFYFTIFIPCVIFIGSFLSILPEYFAKRRYYAELLDLLSQMDKRHLIQEVISRPDFVDGQILYDTLRATGKSMNDEITRYKTAFTEYREYIELWVHEIKTPIAGAKLIGENSNNRAAIEALGRIEALVDQAMYYARSNAVEEDHVIGSAHLSGLVGSALKSNARFLIGREIAVKTEGLDLTVYTDAKWVVFIIRQIIDNAVKYGCRAIEFSGRRRENGVSLSIRDDGVGIPEQDVGRVFQKGFTGENGRTYGHSTGFGLYLCRKLCLKLGLDISLSSEAGKGTTLEISFPVSEL
ncbi:MAG: sensor histidine kinase [Clostridiales Family XIII bacterium]|jgi:signal transduction histidine kinase|nr:sensor histidine kinase [Clostridiales Family XIII bacterium]